MRLYQQAAGLLWLIFGLAVLAHSLRLGIGTPRTPGAGFVSFTASLGLVVLALIQLARDSLVGRAEWLGSPAPLAHIWKVLPSFLALVVYALVLPQVGYGVATFALMLALFLLAQPRRYILAAVAAALAAAATQLLFQYLLNSRFPVGPWAF